MKCTLLVKILLVSILINAPEVYSSGDVNILMPELRSLILSHTDPRDILNFCASSNAQRQFCAPDSVVWRLLIGRDFGENFINLEKLFRSWKDLYIHLFRTRKMMSLASGSHHNALLDSHGNVWTFGIGMSGCLGHGDRETQLEPKKIEKLSIKILAVAAGFAHTVLLDTHGAVWTFGKGDRGELGHGDAKDLGVPKRIEDLPAKIAFVGTGLEYTVLLDANGDVWTFGSDFPGQNNSNKPKKLDLPVKIFAMAVGNFHAVLLDTDGRVWTFGEGHWGKLGHGDREDQLVPKLIEALPARIVSVAAGSSHTVLLDDAGNVWTFGQAFSGQLGHGDDEVQLAPKQIMNLTRKIVAVAAGDEHTLLLDDAGHLLTFGHGLSGQLGHGNDDDQLIPKQIEKLSAKTVAMSAGKSRTLLRDIHGGVWIIGKREWDRDLSKEDEYRPSLIAEFPKN